MMRPRENIKSAWWLIQKDLLRERRAHYVWPGMLLLGLVLVFLLAAQIDLPAQQRARVAGGLLWFAVFFAGTLALERSFSSEREEGCWLALSMYPVAPSVLFLSKMAVNVLALLMLECVLLPAFVVFADVPLSGSVFYFVLVAALGNVGFAAVGTLISALTAGLRHRGGMLALLLLPLVTPVLLASAESSRLALTSQFDSIGWRWIQMLTVCAIVFTIIGALSFEFAFEE